MDLNIIPFSDLQELSGYRQKCQVIKWLIVNAKALYNDGLIFNGVINNLGYPIVRKADNSKIKAKKDWEPTIETA
jgi:hypothetical protein